MDLTIFYDGRCPLCAAEICQLARLDREQRLVFEDIHAPGFAARFPHIEPEAADRLLHGQRSDGSMLYGLDVTCLAWSLVGRHRWLALLRWPVLRWFADLGYWLFARYRHQFSSLLTGKPRCEPGTGGEACGAAGHPRKQADHG